MIDRIALDSIRDGLRSLPSLPAHAAGQEVRPDQIFFPFGHAETLNPQVTLVVGNRGMGKSFWASALAHPLTREAVTKAYSSFYPRQLDQVEVVFGFADAEGGHGAVSRDQITLGGQIAPPEIIWRAVVLRHLAPLVGEMVPDNFAALTRWTRDNVEKQREIFRAADKHLSGNGSRLIFLFDQLDQLADDWSEIQHLTRGLLKVALALKSYRNLSAKIFMRPDQAEDRMLFQFPDASKIYGSRVRLRWRVSELYGLLFFELSRLPSAKAALESLYGSAGIDIKQKHRVLRTIPARVAWDPQAQHRLFDFIAGQHMGASSKRGLPYTWIPVHLADAKGEVSPRTFLQAIRAAADHMPPPSTTSIDHEGIQEGVREASDNRLVELQEDYPWVQDALNPLRGLLVPCDPIELADRWIAHQTAARIIQQYRQTRTPLGLMESEDLFGERDDAARLIDSLADIGVLEVRSNGKVNVPDIFRIKAGILRKGGVTPQQRRTL